MNVLSPAFVVIWLALSGIYWPLRQGIVRRSAFCLVSLGFLALCLPNVASAAVLVGYLLYGYLVALALRRQPSTALLLASIAVMIAAFVVLRHYQGLEYILPQSWLALPVAIVGLSYILFRQIHFMTDMMQGQVESSSLVSYLAYQLSPLTLLAGPIQRYQAFHRFWHQQEMLIGTRHDLLATYQRIFIGVFKAAIVAPFMLGVWAKVINGNGGLFVSQSQLGRLAILFYCYPIYVYFDFSGYCDMMIGFGKLIGLPIPENFDRPYISRNMIDFWARQHMSLSFWIRDYLFTPMYKTCAQWWPKQAWWLVFLCYFVAFFLAGVWHGSTVYFVIYGLLHGLGVSATKIWEYILIRRLGRPGWKEYLKSKAIRVVSTAVTLNYVCLAFVFFTPSPARVLIAFADFIHISH